jgi:hypothetical protein
MGTQMRLLRAAPAQMIGVVQVCALVCTTGCSLAYPQPPAHIGPVVADALVDAHKLGRPILISTTSKWCTTCKLFLRDETISKPLERAVSIFERVVLDSSEQEDDCVALEIEYFPTFIILSPGGACLTRWIGYGPPPEETAERLVRSLYQAGRQIERCGNGQQAYCLYTWAVQAGGAGPLVDAARSAATHLVEADKANPNSRCTWTPSSQLATRLGAGGSSEPSASVGSGND